MTRQPDLEAAVARILAGEDPNLDVTALSAGDREGLIAQLLDSAGGRRWLRNSPLLDQELAGRLLDHSADFSDPRHDPSLSHVIAAAPLDALLDHAPAIAEGAGAPELWQRISHDPDQIVTVVERIAAGGTRDALEATATHLLLDRSDTYGLGEERRTAIARNLLGIESEAARGIAAEYLGRTNPRILADRLDALALDSSSAVRGYAWLAGYGTDREATFEQAIALLGDDSRPVDVRVSALNAAGETLPTAMLVEILSYFVVHPTAEVALAAADLLHRHHRHPEIAIAATGSPHQEVRDIANHLMDPYRGSPAAGGSRPGDPTREDPLIKLMRQLEEEDKTRE